MTEETVTIPQVPVTHTSNHSYSGGRDQEDRSSKAAGQTLCEDPISKNPITKKGWWSGWRGPTPGPEFKTQYCKKRKTKETVTIT
jgi:hypothetical protein